MAIKLITIKEFLIRMCTFNKIKELFAFYTCLLGIVGLLVVSGIIEVKPQLNITILNPVIYIDVNEFRRSYGEPVPFYIDGLFKTYGDERYIEIGMPEITSENFNKVRIINDGYKLYGGSTLGHKNEFQYELGWISEPDFWLGLIPDTGLKSREDRRIGVSNFIGFNALDLPFIKGSMYKSDLQEDIFKKLYDSIADPKEKDKILRSYASSRTVYNIISLENRSDQKIYNVFMKANASVPGASNQAIAWTHSAEIIKLDTSTAYLATFNIPYLRPRTSIEFVIRSNHLYKMNDLSWEWDRLKNLNISTLKIWSLILFIFSMLLMIVDVIFIGPYVEKLKKKVKP